MGAITGLITLEEFERLPGDKQGYKLELLNGEILRMPPAFFDHMQIAMRVYDFLKASLQSQHGQGHALELGQVTIETGYDLGGNFLIPDVGVTHAGQPVQKYPQGAPALAIEVISESNTAETMHRKILCYFEHGAREVWLFHPRTRSVTVYCGDRWLEVRDTLTTALFPGLAINLSEIFGA